GPLGGATIDPVAAPPPVPPPTVEPSTTGWIVPTTIVIGVLALLVLGRAFLGGDTGTPVAPNAAPPRIVEPVTGPVTEGTSTEAGALPTTEADAVPEIDAEATTPETEAAHTAPTSTAERPRRQVDDEGEHAVAPSSDDPSSSLREEVALMERAMRHRREGDVAGVRAALAEHAARFPDGHLAPERTRLLGELAAEGATP
ncbi:MAG: hypothetical protein J0L92_40960, partial [Deltaproteobacteria bacterium]|nr:hypothetical protein [Deltaproteobacteria bacterium]